MNKLYNGTNNKRNCFQQENHKEILRVHISLIREVLIFTLDHLIRLQKIFDALLK